MSNEQVDKKQRLKNEREINLGMLGHHKRVIEHRRDIEKSMLIKHGKENEQ